MQLQICAAMASAPGSRFLPSRLLPDYRYPNGEAFAALFHRTRYVGELSERPHIESWVAWAATEVHRRTLLDPELAKYRSYIELKELILTVHSSPSASLTIVAAEGLIDDVVQVTDVVAAAAVRSTLATFTSDLTQVLKRWKKLCPDDDEIDFGQWHIKESAKVSARS